MTNQMAGCFISQANVYLIARYVSVWCSLANELPCSTFVHWTPCLCVIGVQVGGDDCQCSHQPRWLCLPFTFVDGQSQSASQSSPVSSSTALLSYLAASTIDSTVVYSSITSRSIHVSSKKCEPTSYSALLRLLPPTGPGVSVSGRTPRALYPLPSCWSLVAISSSPLTGSSTGSSCCMFGCEHLHLALSVFLLEPHM